MHEGLKPCQFRQVDPQGRILCNLIKGGDREVSVNLCRACPVQQINCQHLRAGLAKQVSTPITVRFATGRVEVWDDAPPSIDFKQAACAVKTMPIHSPRDCVGCPLRLPNVVPQSAIQVAHHTKPTPQQDGIAAYSMSDASNPMGKHDTAAAVAAPPASRAQPRHRHTDQPVPVAQASATVQPNATPQPAPTNSPLEAVSTAAADIVARARAAASKKAEQREQMRRETASAQAAAPAPAGETKSKIIQMQAWLSGQLSRKQASQPLPVQADQDGVSDIVYAPLGGQLAQAYQETVDYERCVGWTD